MQKFFSLRIWFLHNTHCLHHCYWVSSGRCICVFKTQFWHSLRVQEDVIISSFLKINILIRAKTEFVLIKFFMHPKIISRFLVIKTLILTVHSKLCSRCFTLSSPFSLSLWACLHFCCIWAHSLNLVIFSLFPKFRRIGWIWSWISVH